MIIPELAPQKVSCSVFHTWCLSEGTGKVLVIRGMRWIGVGRIRRRSPSLRTVPADLPHTALQLMGHLFKGLTALTRAAVREYNPYFTKNASGQR